MLTTRASTNMELPDVEMIVDEFETNINHRGQAYQ